MDVYLLRRRERLILIDMMCSYRVVESMEWRGGFLLRPILSWGDVGRGRGCAADVHLRGARGGVTCREISWCGHPCGRHRGRLIGMMCVVEGGRDGEAAVVYWILS